jgi:SAM-dependent methyltransferase
MRYGGSVNEAVAGPSQTGFDFDLVDVGDYERYRPEYSAEAVEWFVGTTGLTPDDPMVDLGAGTGKLTRVLAGAGLSVVAVEPSAKMRAKLTEMLAGVEVRDGTAEAIPAADGELAAVTAGQAFHHFRPEQALHEIHRALRPGGHLALFWNLYLPEDRVRRALDEIIDRHIPPESAVQAAFGSWREAFAKTTLFEQAAEARSFPTTHALPREKLRPLMATSSDVASLPVAERDLLLAEIGALAATLPDPFVIGSETRLDLYRRT